MVNSLAYDRQTVIIVLLLSLLFTTLVGSANYFGLPTVAVLAPVPVIVVFLFGLYTIRLLSYVHKQNTRYAGILVHAMKMSIVYMLSYTVARVLLGIVAPVMRTDLLYSILVGVQVGTLISFFYLLSRAGGVLERGAEELGTNWNLPANRQLLMRAALDSIIIGIVSVIAVYFVPLYFTNVSLFIFVATASVMGAGALLILLKMEIRYSRGRLSERTLEVLEKIEFGALTLVVFVVTNAIQELLYPRVPDGNVIVAASSIQLASVLLTFFTIYYILNKFRYAATEVEFLEGRYREKFIE